MANQTNSMAHTKWMCKYHIVFTPKYRRKVIYNQYKEDIRDIIKALCKYKGVEIIEGHLMPDHIHMLVSIPPKYSISQFMGYLKGNSALMIYDKHANCYCSQAGIFWTENAVWYSGGSRFCRFGMRSIGKIRYWNEVRVNSNILIKWYTYRNFNKALFFF